MSALPPKADTASVNVVGMAILQVTKRGLMIKFFLETVSAVFAALALLTFTASAFTFTWPVTMKWLLLGAGFAAVGGGAQLLLLFFHL